MKKIIAILLSVLLAAFAVGCAATPEPAPQPTQEPTASADQEPEPTAEPEPEPATINVIYHPTIGGSTAIATAITQGFFEEENLNVNLQMYTSGPPEIAAMV
ncbi:MAG: hypothetical protein ACI4MR_02230, partial [Candidatus Aphodomorpha sp.]